MLSTCRLTTSKISTPLNPRKLALVFPGQGAQYVGMAADLYNKYTVAQQVMEETEEILKFNLKKIMFEGPMHQLTLTQNTQPAILAHSIAVLRVLESEYGFDVSHCSYALGHSLGEYTALVATKSLALRDALKLVRLRGNLMQETIVEGETCMRAVVIDGDRLEDVIKLLEKVQKSLPPREVAEIANINSRTQIVLSGTNTGVSYMASIINTQGFAGRAVGLPVSCPFHCSIMKGAQEKMKLALDATKFEQPIIPVVSNVNALAYESPSQIKNLLCKQITATVQWQKSTLYVHNDKCSDWYVLGPARVLTNLVKRDYPGDRIVSFSTCKEIDAYGTKQS